MAYSSEFRISLVDRIATFARGILILLALAALPARVDLDISVTQGTISTQPIAIVPFAEPAGAPTDVAQVIENDLVYSGLFRTISRNLMLEKPTDPAQVDYRNWRTVGMNNIVIGQLRAEGVGYSARFFILDVYGKNPPVGFEVQAVQPKDLRHLAHQISDIIYKQLTGTPGYFNTRLAYVTVTGNIDQVTKRQWQLTLADSDGEDPVRVAFPPPGQPLMSPSWSPDGKQLAFVAYDNRGRSSIYVYTVASGEHREYHYETAVNIAPAWSPDGRYLAASLSFDGNENIYIIDLATGSKRRLTTNAGIDTSPTWSPDGQWIAFNSDRGGSPQIYRVSAQGGQPQRLTFQGRQNLKPVFSPDGKKIALVNMDANSDLRIALFDLQSQQMKFLTDGPVDDSPSFAPSGNILMYERIGAGGGVALATVSTDGLIKRDVRILNTQVQSPAWSTYLQ